MKIICVGRNYNAHIRELDNEKPSSPVIFLKPPSSILRGNIFYLPQFSQVIHYETEIILKISREGKQIQLDKASQYFDSIGLGLDLTARDLQKTLKSKGLPWELAKAFDDSAVISRFVSKARWENTAALQFQLLVNGEIRQDGNTKSMIFSFAEIISFISKYMRLETDDIIFTGTPAGVSRLKPGDHLQGYIQNESFLDLQIK